MNKVAIAVYKKLVTDNAVSIEQAFYKAVFLRLSNYAENAVYGIIFDLPDAPCYRSSLDSKIENDIMRCYGALPKIHKDGLFIAVRPRRYSLKPDKGYAYCCENGYKGALRDLTAESTSFPFLLGELPKDIDAIYFSGSDGIIEAGGINTLIGLCKTTKKSLFPQIKLKKLSANDGKYKDVSCFSGLEGLYLKRDLGIAATKKRKKGGIPIKSVTVSDMPLSPMIYEKNSQGKGNIKLQRFPYRAFLSACRVFSASLEKGFSDIVTPIDAAYILNALAGMKMFGYLGKTEAFEATEEVIALLKELLYITPPKKICGKLLFLLTALDGTYLFFADSESIYWSLKLQISDLISLINKRISSFIAYYNDIYANYCYKHQVLSAHHSLPLPRLIQAYICDRETDIYSFSALGTDSFETALAVIVCCVNVSFKNSFKHALLSTPVFLSRYSFLQRSLKNGIEKAAPPPSCYRSRPRSISLTELLLTPGLINVRSGLTERGILPKLIPITPHPEPPYKRFRADNKATRDILCYNMQTALKTQDPFQQAPNPQKIADTHASPSASEQ